MRMLFAVSAAVALLMLALALAICFGPEDRPRSEECAMSAEFVESFAVEKPCGHASGCECEEMSSLPAMDCEHEREVAQHVICPECSVGHSHRTSIVCSVFAELERSLAPRPTMKTPTSGDGPFDEHAHVRPEISKPEVSAAGVLA